MKVGSVTNSWIGGLSVLPIMLVLTVELAMAQGVGLSPVAPPWREELSPRRTEERIQVGSHEIDVELALTSEERRLGLGYREGLAPESGMLFINEPASPASFWMKGMRFCLDIIWIEGGQIVGAAESVCPDPEGTADADRATFLSPGPVQYILEMPAGWLEDHDYGQGTPVEVSPRLDAL
ncbi:MAG: DUF192 domain-containing protein [Chloroflexota bacterium]|nr:DUF192 domain-containing protein [Chloroflexota bacterium]